MNVQSRLVNKIIKSTEIIFAITVLQKDLPPSAVNL